MLNDLGIFSIQYPHSGPFLLPSLKLICLSLHTSAQVQTEDVENEEKRYALFLELLGAVQKWEDFQLLMLLLQAWPPMMKEEV